MRQHFINKTKIHLVILIYFNQAVNHLFQICAKKTEELFGLSEPHGFGK